MSNHKWEVGQTVDVQSRTWAGINKPGGCAKITNIHYSTNGLNVEAIDVKYVLGGGREKEIDPAIVSPFETLARGGRKRRGRDFLMDRAEVVVTKVKEVMSKKRKTSTNTKTIKKAVKANSKSQTAAKLCKGRDQSTSASTPVTPEHPSMTKSSRSSKISTMTTVPKYVLADTGTTVEVSPLPLDRSINVVAKKPVARRGLFGSSATTKKKTVKVAHANLKQPAKTNEDIDDADSSSSLHKSAKDIRRAHSALVKQTLTTKQGRGQLKLTSKKSTLDARKSVAVNPRTIGKSKKKTSLKSVYDDERRKAQAFMDSVRQAPTQDILSEKVNEASTENRLDTSGSEGDEEKHEKSLANTRQDEFLALFQSMRRIFEYEDGSMEESAFRTLIAQKAVKPFTSSELDTHLNFLYEQGKVMKSDGVLYIID